MSAFAFSNLLRPHHKFDMVDNGQRLISPKTNPDQYFTFYSRGRPCMRIDYALTSGVQLKSYRVVKHPISDHSTILVTL
jgi:endonuclease/exonuclease/phosphatase (EEP) superfamily protein YafD